MRNLIVTEFITLDGVIQSPGSPDEDLSGGFQFGGWVVPYHDEAVGQALQALYAEPFELLLGRRTYDIWAEYWPKVKAGHPIGDLFNRVAKHVATHHPDSLAWANSRALEGGIIEAVGELKAREGPDLLTHGSGALVRRLLTAGLVDELQLLTYPIVVGNGRRLFGDDAEPSAFTVAGSTCTAGGVVVTRYQRGGEVRTASFGPA